MASERRIRFMLLACFLFCLFQNRLHTANLYLRSNSVWDFHTGKQNPIKLMVHTETASLCVICKDENAYIDEWTDYNLALGFSEIFFYDNSENNTLVSWKEKSRRGDERISIIHFPGPGRQFDSYLSCAREAYAKNHTWAGFFDVDEFLVLKKHNSVLELLHDHCQSGALSINWYMFGSSNHLQYSPIPVTKRFQWRDPNPMHLVKEIVRLSDMNMLVTPISPHYVLLLNGTRHDTNNTILTKWYQVNGPVDVAILHHYFTKSNGEFYQKSCLRGTVTDVETKKKMSKCGMKIFNGTFFDDSAWKELKKRVPLYGVYDYSFLSSTGEKLVMKDQMV